MKIKIAFNRMATAEKLPQGDPRWSEFNDSFVNMELEPIEIANYIYGGHAYTAWHNGRRKLENFVCSQFIAIDLDSGDERSSFAHLEKNELVQIYAGLMHTTPSHTPSAPRARIIFFFDAPLETPESVNAIAKFLIAQFDGADQSCKDASRFFYGAKDCDIWFSEHVFPLARLRLYYKAWLLKQPKPKPAKPISTPTELKDVEQALRRINPWSLEYTQWIAIIAALHDTYGDAALGLAVEWGAGYEGEVERKWRTFGHYPGNRAGLGTIFELSRQKAH